MTAPIEFRVHLSRSRDWDASLKRFHCAALKIPGASVTGLSSCGVALADSSYRIDRSHAWIALEVAEPPDQLIATLQLRSALTTRSLAGMLGGASALLIAVVTGVSQFMTAVVPARLQADTARLELEAKRDLVRTCEERQHASEPAPAPTSVTTRGDYSPVLQGNGHIVYGSGSDKSP